MRVRVSLVWDLIPYAEFVLKNKSHFMSSVTIQVIVNGIPIQRAINAYELQGILPRSTVYSRVAAAKRRGAYSVPRSLTSTMMTVIARRSRRMPRLWMIPLGAGGCRGCG